MCEVKGGTRPYIQYCPEARATGKQPVKAMTLIRIVADKCCEPTRETVFRRLWDAAYGPEK